VNARAVLGVGVLSAACTAAPAERMQPRVGDPVAHGGDLQVLAFSRTTGFRHASIDVAVPALQQLGVERGWTVDATEDPATFTTETLAGYDVVVFLLTTGDVLDDAQQQAFEGFIAQGRGYVGVHSASDTEYDWPWYGEMLGGYFSDHPAPQQATIHVVDAAHPSTEHLGQPWIRFDEWYNFAPNPSATVDVLLRLDESTYSGGTMGDDHPIAWTREHGGGRAFYTGGGHTNESWAEAEFLAHVAGGIAWAGTLDEGSGTSSGSAGGSGSSAAGSSSSEPAGTDESGTPASTGAGSSSSTGVPGSTGADTATDTDASPGSDGSESGCDCRTSAPTPAFAWMLLLLAIPRGSARRSARSPAPACRAAPARTAPRSRRR
jgi:type 1 glutamine amidotransferase